MKIHVRGADKEIRQKLERLVKDNFSAYDIEWHDTDECQVKEDEQYRTVFENTGTATVILESDGTISLANKKFAALAGYSLDEIINKKRWMDFVVPDDLKRMEEQHKLRRADRKKALREYDFRFIGRNKDVRDIHLVIDIIPDSSRSVASLLDVTERREVERQLIELKDKLQMQVEEKTKELNERISDLERFRDATIDRELRMKELRDEIKRLKG